MARNKPPTTLDQMWLCPSHLLLLGVSSKWWGPAAYHDIHHPPLAQTGLGRGQPQLIPLSCSSWCHISAVSHRTPWFLYNTWTDWSCFCPCIQTVSSLCSRWRHGHSPDLEMALMVFPYLITFLIISGRCFCFPSLTDIPVILVDWCFWPLPSIGVVFSGKSAMVNFEPRLHR